MKLLFILILSLITISGCSSGGKELYVIGKKDSLCFFTKDHKTDYAFDGDLLLSFGKFTPNKEFVTDYEKSYKGHKLPIENKNCLEISKDNFKVNTVYLITLETNKIYHALICIQNRNDKLIVRKVKAGETTCN